MFSECFSLIAATWQMSCEMEILNTILDGLGEAILPKFPTTFYWKTDIHKVMRRKLKFQSEETKYILKFAPYISRAVFLVC